MSYYYNRLRRKLIRFLIGKMEVCANMRIKGSISYDGTNGGVVNFGNQFE